MTVQRKYLIGIGAMAFVFVYLLMTVVWDRWIGTINQYRQLAQKQTAILSEQDLLKLKSELIARRNHLTNEVTKGSAANEQNQIGLVKFLDVQARQSHIALQTLNPFEPRKVGQLTEAGFKVGCLGSYHRLGVFVNNVETGPYAMQITKIDFVLQSRTSSVIQAALEGKAAFVSRENER